MPITTPNVETLQHFVLAKCESFTTMGLWPAGEKLKPRKWLANFRDIEKEHALYLLNSFTYFNIDMCIALLKSSILQLSSQLRFENTLAEQTSKWKQFLADAIFVPVTGEFRNVTDSGNMLAGHLRRDLGVPEYNILTLDQLYDAGYSSLLSRYKHLIFFDDFVGSGQQFISMWTEQFERDTRFFVPVKNQCEKLNLNAHYCAMIATTYGLNRISTLAPEVSLNFSHVLKESASPIHTQSTTWPEHLQTSGPDFIMEASRRAGIPDAEVKGFHSLALSLAFSFTIPDATLPIFRWASTEWTPLMEKS